MGGWGVDVLAGGLVFGACGADRRGLVHHHDLQVDPDGGWMEIYLADAAGGSDGSGAVGGPDGRAGRQLDIRRRVKLVESVLVRAPMVIGQLRPIIYIPLGLINHLPASEMEAVLLHELAHIRRYDYVVNMVQQVAECLLFFNPGFLWISSLLREERENCCDDIAIAHTRDRVEFVRALVRFKEHSLRGWPWRFRGTSGSCCIGYCGYPGRKTKR